MIKKITDLRIRTKHGKKKFAGFKNSFCMVCKYVIWIILGIHVHSEGSASNHIHCVGLS